MNKTNKERAYRVITENIPEDAFNTIFKFDGVDYTALRDAIEQELIEVEKQGMDKGEMMSKVKAGFVIISPNKCTRRICKYNAPSAPGVNVAGCINEKVTLTRFDSYTSFCWSYEQVEPEPEPELKPCPFCGCRPCSLGHEPIKELNKGSAYWVCCTGCREGRTDRYLTKEAAYTAWNKRTP